MVKPWSRAGVPFSMEKVPHNIIITFLFRPSKVVLILFSIIFFLQFQKTQFGFGLLIQLIIFIFTEVATTTAL